MLAKEAKGQPWRLIGIGIAELVPAEAVERDLFAGDERRALTHERTIDTLRARFGAGALTSGRAFRSKTSPQD